MNVLLDYINELNWLAVFVAAALAFLTSALWYSQSLFGKRWMKEVGLKMRDINKGNTNATLAVTFVLYLIGAAAVAILLDVLAIDGLVNGALLGALVGIAFVLTSKATSGIFEQKSILYMKIVIVGDIVALMVMGAVLGLLR